MTGREPTRTTHFKTARSIEPLLAQRTDVSPDVGNVLAVCPIVSGIFSTFAIPGSAWAGPDARDGRAGDELAGGRGTEDVLVGRRGVRDCGREGRRGCGWKGGDVGAGSEQLGRDVLRAGLTEGGGERGARWEREGTWWGRPDWGWERVVTGRGKVGKRRGWKGVCVCRGAREGRELVVLELVGKDLALGRGGRTAAGGGRRAGGVGTGVLGLAGGRGGECELVAEDGADGGQLEGVVAWM